MIVGRKTEVAWLTARLSEGAPLLTVVGAPGVGKSRLLEELKLPVCDLGGAETREEIVTAVRRLLGPIDDVGARLASGPMVIVFDEAERATRALVLLFEEWLANAPELQTIVGSREQLGLAEEQVLSLEPLENSDAAALWLARTHRRPEDIDPKEHADLEGLLAATGGLPLAIVLAASRWPLLSAQDLARRSPEILGLRATLDRSWELLSDVEKDAFMKASVFRGGFTLESAEALVGSEDALDIIQSLFRKSLLQLRRASRLAMLQPIRELAAKKLQASGLEESTVQKHEETYSAHLDRRAREIDRVPLSEAIEWFDEEALNVLFAIDHALSRNDIARACKMTADAAALGAWSAHQGDIAVRMATIQAHPSFRSLPSAASLLLGFAVVGPSGQSRLDALALARDLAPDPITRTRAAIALLPPLADAKRLDEAEALVAEIDTGNDVALASELARRRASIPYARGRLDQAQDDARRALDLARSPRLEYAALVTLSFLTAEAGDTSKALRLGAQAKELLGPRSAEGDAPLLASQGYAHHARGEYATALGLYAKALERLPTSGQLTSLLRGYTALASFQKDERDPRDELERVIGELRPVAPAHALLFEGYLGVVEQVFGEKSDRAARAFARASTVTQSRARALAICAAKPGDEPGEGIEVMIAEGLVGRLQEGRRPKPHTAHALVASDGSWFEVDGQRTLCTQRPVMQRLLAALASADKPLTTDALVGRTWPGERMLRDAARNRIRVLVARLRDLGLRGALLGGDTGYELRAERVAITS